MCLNVPKRNLSKLLSKVIGGLECALVMEQYGINGKNVKDTFRGTIEFYYNPETGAIKSCGIYTSGRIKKKYLRGTIEVAIDVDITWTPNIEKINAEPKTPEAEKNLEETVKLYNNLYPR